MANNVKFLVFLAFTITIAFAVDNPCQLRTTDSGGICVCNATYCDTIPSLEQLNSTQYQLYSTSKQSLGFFSTSGSFSDDNSTADVTVTVDDVTKTHQTILGFGGAFTDATGINILKLSQEAQDLLVENYFGESGIQYSFGRVPVGGTDFSTEGYTYCDEEDETLESFALRNEDFDYKIPFIQKAIQLRGIDNFKLYASAWSAPKWMKDSNEYNGIGKLFDNYYGLWAQYYIKFFDAYKENDINFWGLTTQNEPMNGVVGFVVPNNGFNATDMVKWVRDNLGPTIRNSSYSDLKIILHDDLRSYLPMLNEGVFNDSEAIQYADGVGVHWYDDSTTSASYLDLISSAEKDLFRLMTEACEGFLSLQDEDIPVDLGSWQRAENYLDSIFTYLSYDFVGWVDWNMALDEEGGPNWIDNHVDSPVIVNGTADEFYKQPMFYALGHFSKFIVTGSVRIDSETTGDDDVASLAFVRPDGNVAVVLKNNSDQDKSVKVNIQGSSENVLVEANSVNTLIYAL